MTTSIHDQARIALRAFVMQYGHQGEMPTANNSFPCNGHPNECWTNAWEGSGVYVEGYTLRPDGKTWTTHAWNLNAFGVVIERTPGFEQAGTRYFGIAIDREGALAAIANKVMGKDRWRTSVLEAALMGSGPERTIEMLRAGRGSEAGWSTVVKPL